MKYKVRVEFDPKYSSLVTIHVKEKRLFGARRCLIESIGGVSDMRTVEMNTLKRFVIKILKQKLADKKTLLTFEFDSSSEDVK